MRERPSRLRSVQDLETSKGGLGSPMNRNRLPTIQLLRCPKRPRSLLRQSTTRRGNAPASQDAPDRHRFRDRPGRPDYTVHSGQWDVGRIYETRGGLQLLVFEDGVKDPVDCFQSRATPLLMARSIASTLTGTIRAKISRKPAASTSKTACRNHGERYFVA